MVLPLMIVVAAMVSGLMTIGLLSHSVSVPPIGPTVATLIGLGVSIDYALFVVTRHRSNIKAGIPPLDAAARTLDSSGRAVLFGGTTVCIALPGMLVLRVSYVSGPGDRRAVHDDRRHPAAAAHVGAPCAVRRDAPIRPRRSRRPV
jgi:RND superfamily putative drug exporter